MSDVSRAAASDWENATTVKIEQGATTATIVAAVAGKKVRVLSMGLVATAAGTFRFENTDGTDLTGPMAFAINGGIAPDGPSLVTATGLGLQLVSSAACAGWVTYVQRGGASD